MAINVEYLEWMRRENSSYFKNLKSCMEAGIIDAAEASQKEKMQKKKIIQEHEKQHKIFFSEKERRWKTHLPATDKTKDRLIARKNREDLENEIVEFYMEQKSAENHTIRNLFDGYIDQKENLEKISASSLERYRNVWSAIEGEPILDVKIEDLTRREYKTWAMDYLSRNPMTKKSFDTIQIVLKGIIRYAADMDYITIDILNNIAIPSNCFKKKEFNPRKQPFTDEEVSILAEYLFREYLQKPAYTVPLAILFIFLTGLRPAELEALRFSDIDEDGYVHIQRHQAKAYDENGRLSRLVIKDGVKTVARMQPVYLVEDARILLGLVKEANKLNGDIKEDYIFYSQHKNVTTAAINSCLRRACEATGVLVRCIYTARKTYCTVLVNAGVNLSTITTAMGHAEPGTTLRYYVKDRDTKSEASEKLERALHENMPSIRDLLGK